MCENESTCKRRPSNIPETFYTFDDVILVPKHESSIASRRDVDISSSVTGKIKLENPVISSYMPAVTGHEMAIAMARDAKGLGIIHRSMTIEDQAREIELVKRAESRIIGDPYTISTSATVGDVKRQLKQLKVGMLLVANDRDKILRGVVSTRDVDLEEDESLSVVNVMTPFDELVVGQPNITSSDAKKLLKTHRLENIPLVDDKGMIKGLVSKKDLGKMENEFVSRDEDGRLLVGASIGLRGKDYLDRATACLQAGADLIVIAVANGYLSSVVEATRILRSNFPNIDIAVGCTADYYGTMNLFEAGADTVLVGIGPGSVCETRVVAGVGKPQFSALLDAQRAARQAGKHIISDGGVHEPHHFNKAIFAGASGVILGSALAGTDESPGEIKSLNGTLFKAQWGLASDRARRDFDALHGEDRDEEDYPANMHIAAEGVEEGLTPYTGNAREAIMRITGGIRSCMTYMAASDIPTLWKRCNEGLWGVVTDAGLKESKPHHLYDIRT
ncbi:MAG: IMP dehydrogenase [Candidatus Spechtbacterales bacterium]|nr:IMP dehydrogenase [Candidatus Spechtbacterales bacterium]